MFHVSFFWQQTISKTGGWSENFWNNQDSKSSVKTQADKLLEACTASKGAPVFCPRYRISQVGSFRNTTTILTQQVPIAAATPSTEADYPTTKVQVKLRSATQFTNQWLGGLYDRDVRHSGFWAPTGTSVPLYNAIVTILTTPGNSWNIYVLDPANVPWNIIAFNATTGIVTTIGSNILDQAKVRIKGVKGIKAANGIWRVTKTADQTYQLQGWVSTTEIFGRSNATMRTHTYIGQPIASVEYVQSTSHKVGKPTNLLGGRRKKRAS